MPLNMQATPPMKTVTQRALVVVIERIRSFSPRLEPLSIKLTNLGSLNGLLNLLARIIP